MATYQKVLDVTGAERSDLILRVADHASIPADPDNADWQAYQAWLEAGHAPAEPAANAPAGTPPPPT